jgi:hypothetical protein
LELGDERDVHIRSWVYARWKRYPIAKEGTFRELFSELGRHRMDVMYARNAMRAIIIASVFLCALGSATVAEENNKLFQGAFRGGSDPDRREHRTSRYPHLGLTRDQVLGEANKHFTYFSKPIHPKLVNEFECSLSDQNPVTLAVDVSAAYDTNEYNQPVTHSSYGVTYEKTYRQDVRRRCYYAYQRLGTLDGQIHVLKTADYGGGSGVFMNLLFVRFEISRGYYPDGAPYDSLVMLLVRSRNLTDRFTGAIEVLSDRVVVRQSDGSVEAILGPEGNYE